MKRLTLLAALLAAFSTQASTVLFSVTNSDGTPFTNYLSIFPLSTPIYVGGEWSIAGKSKKLQFDSIGQASIHLERGDYLATNSGYYISFEVGTNNVTNHVEELVLPGTGGSEYAYVSTNYGTKAQITVTSNALQSQITLKQQGSLNLSNWSKLSTNALVTSGVGGSATTNASDLTTGTLAWERLPEGVLTNGQGGVMIGLDGNTPYGASVTSSNEDVYLNLKAGVGQTWIHFNSGLGVDIPYLYNVSSNALDAGTKSQLAKAGDASSLTVGTVPIARLSGITSNQFDVWTAAQLALAGTAKNLTVGTNTFGAWSNYVAGVYLQSSNLFISGSTNLAANGEYAQLYWTPVGEEITAMWTNGNSVAISGYYDGSDWYWDITNAVGTAMLRIDNGTPTPTFFLGGLLLKAATTETPDGAMYWASNTVALPYWTHDGWTGDKSLVIQSNISAQKLHGDISGCSNYDTVQIKGVYTSNLVSTLNVNTTLRRGAAPLPTMGFVSGELLGSSETVAIGRARYLYTNGLTAAGYNIIALDANWAGRDTNGLPMLKTNLYPSGLASLLNALATNDCRLGLYCSMFAPYGSLFVDESTAYRDGYTMASWGIASLKVDGGQQDAISEIKARHIGELLAAGIDAACADFNLPPVFISFNSPTNRTWTATFANGQYSTVPVQNAVGAGDSLNTSAFNAYRSLYALVTNYPAQQTFGVQVNPMNCGDGTDYSYWDTNCTRVLMGLHCLEGWTLWMGDTHLNGTHASHLGIWTNREAIRINQDVAVGPAHFLSTNCVTITNATTQKARWRRMANGDIAVGLWNWNTNNTSLFTLNLARVPFLQTNVAYVLNVFDRTASLVTNTLSQVVNTNGYNLLRISKLAPLNGDGAGIANLNASALATGTVDAARLPESLVSSNLLCYAATGGGITLSNLTGTKTIRMACDQYASALYVAGGNILMDAGKSVGFNGYNTYASGNGYANAYSGGNFWVVLDADNNSTSSKFAIGNNLLSPTTPTNDLFAVYETGDAKLSGVFTPTNGIIIKSNSWLAVPTLVPGDVFLTSSNGVPTKIWSDAGGVLHTNQ